MAANPHTTSLLPYIVVQTDDEWRESTNTLLSRWVIVDGRGETVSPAVPRQSAFEWCAALMWWLTAPVKGLLREPGAIER
jgi:hypothetical protein